VACQCLSSKYTFLSLTLFLSIRIQITFIFSLSLFINTKSTVFCGNNWMYVILNFVIWLFRLVKRFLENKHVQQELPKAVNCLRYTLTHSLFQTLLFLFSFLTWFLVFISNYFVFSFYLDDTNVNFLFFRVQRLHSKRHLRILSNKHVVLTTSILIIFLCIVMVWVTHKCKLWY
jgi:hypothetical protein